MSRFSQSALWRSGVMLALILASGSASAATLVCRGGDVGLRGWSADLHGAFRLDLNYKRYTGPAEAIRFNGSHLAAGECSLTNGYIPDVQQGGIYYYTRLENFDFDVNMRRNGDSQVSKYGSLALNPLATDSFLAFIPTIYEWPESKIFDPNSYWIFFVIDKGNEYEMYNMRRLR